MTSDRGPQFTSQLSPKEDLGCSLPEMVYGAPLTMPRDLVPSCSFHFDNLLRSHVHDQVRSLLPIHIQ